MPIVGKCNWLAISGITPHIILGRGSTVIYITNRVFFILKFPTWWNHYWHGLISGEGVPAMRWTIRGIFIHISIHENKQSSGLFYTGSFMHENVTSDPSHFSGMKLHSRKCHTCPSHFSGMKLHSRKFVTPSPSFLFIHEISFMKSATLVHHFFVHEPSFMKNVTCGPFCTGNLVWKKCHIWSIILFINK